MQYTVYYRGLYNICIRYQHCTTKIYSGDCCCRIIRIISFHTVRVDVVIVVVVDVDVDVDVDVVVILTCIIEKTLLLLRLVVSMNLRGLNEFPPI